MKKPVVMIVEDEQIVALDLQAKLRAFGYPDTVLASSGQEAVEKAVEAQPDLVLMDIMLEGEMDGLEAAARIREHLKSPIIFLTSHADDETTARAMNVLPDSTIRFVMKPIQEMIFKTTLETILQRPAG